MKRMVMAAALVLAACGGNDASSAGALSGVWRGTAHPVGDGGTPHEIVLSLSYEGAMNGTDVYRGTFSKDGAVTGTTVLGLTDGYAGWTGYTSRVCYPDGRPDANTETYIGTGSFDGTRIALAYFNTPCAPRMDYRIALSR